jgi:uncharacterized membrane protein YcaP (DUF421 family)
MHPHELALTAARAAVIYFALLVLIRLLGKRTIGNFSAFDLIVALILGDLVDEPIYGEAPISQALIGIGAITALAWFDSYLSYRSSLIDRVLGGQPVVLIDRGELNRKNMAREHVNEAELWSLLREHEIDDIADVERGTLETNGQLSILKVEGARPLRKADLSSLRTARG